MKAQCPDYNGGLTQLREVKGMLKPSDRCRRDSTLFQFTTRSLRGFIGPHHERSFRTDEQFDFGKLVAPLFSVANRPPAALPRRSTERIVWLA